MTVTRLRKIIRAAAAALAAASLAACSALYTPAPSVSLLEPLDGATVNSPFKLRFGVEGMVVAPAGDSLPNSGHHHLVINGEAVPTGQSVPFTERSLHFGKGQTEAEITLPPGSYSLTAQFANGAHQSYGQTMSQTIRVTVK
jgi:hypothetical protein